MRLSTYRNARDNEPKPAIVSWDEFVRDFAPHDFTRGSKLRLPAVSPAIYAPGDTRSNENVIALSSWWGDFDDLTDEQAADVLARMRWRGLAYTTWQHSTKPQRFRVVVALSREVRPDEWADLWLAINHALGDHCDTTCTDVSRIYFAMCAPPGTEADAWHHEFQGEPADVDALLTGTTPTSPPTTPPAAGLTPLARGRVQAFSATLRRKTDDYKAELGRMLKKLCDGEAFAEPGAIDDTMFKLCAVLAERFTDATPESVGELFAPSLQLMATHNPAYTMTPEQAAAKFTRSQSKIQEQEQEQHQAANAERAARIKDAFGSDRTHPYTEAEIAGFNSPRWIVQKGRAFYTFVMGEYRGPYTNDEITNAALRDLAPACTAGVEFFTITPRGETVPKPLGRLIREYGFIATNVAASLSATRSYFDEPTRTIVEAPTPLRKIKPRYHAEIDQWLEHLAGERVHLLKAWIAAVTLLDKPCTALFLTGVGAAGKSLLARGLARLWTVLGMPTPLEDVLTGFNDALLGCPLVFADERLPTDFRGQVLNAELRHFIQATRRKLRRKYLATADLIGAARLIIGANNEEILATNENLSNHDIGATIERYLHIRACVAAVIYLKQIDHTVWVEHDMIAEHALWLRDNYDWKPNGRFLVQSKDAELHAKLATGSGIRSAVCQFLVGYLLEPGKVDNDARGAWWVRVHDGNLYVNTQALVRCWEQYVSNERCPTTGRLASAIASLSLDGRSRLALPNGKRPNYRMIDPTHLYAWGEQTGYATKEQIDQALATNTEASATNTLN